MERQPIISDLSVQAFFDEYAEALLSLSAERISAFYQTPLAIYSDENTQTVSESDEVSAFWKEGIKPYKAQNIDKAIPTILSEEQLSKTIFISKVRWNNYDKSGKEVSKETNFYILSQQDDELKISGLIIMTK